MTEMERPNRRVLILCGGPSSEHVVSLTSARCVAHALDKRRYTVRVSCILENGDWVCPEEEWGPDTPKERIDKLFDLLDMPESQPRGYFTMRSPAEGIIRMVMARPNIVLPIMHGAFGEDGRIQGMLDVLDIPYIGCGVGSSALAMDKRRTKDYLNNKGFRMARHITIKRDLPTSHREDQMGAAGALLGWPIVVKPSRGGSSIATQVCSTPEELHKAVFNAFDSDSEVLLEEHIEGREVTCGILDMAEAYGGRIVCPVTEITPKSAKFFNFDAKYRPDATIETTPADMPEEVTARIQAMAEKAHELLGCFGLSRTDMIVPDDGIPVYLETNTMPGMTPTSLLPQGAAALDIGMASMLTGLIEGVFESLVPRQAEGR